MSELPHERWARERRDEQVQSDRLRALLRRLPEPWALRTPEPVRHHKDRVVRSVVEGCGLRVILSAPIGEDRYHIDIVRIDGRSVDADEWQMALDALLTEQQQLDLASEYDEGLRVSRHTCSIDVIR